MFTYSDMTWRERLVGFIALWFSSTLGLTLSQILVGPFIGATFRECFDRVFYMSTGCFLTLTILFLSELSWTPKRRRSEIHS